MTLSSLVNKFAIGPWKRYKARKLNMEIHNPNSKATFVVFFAASPNPAPKKFAILVDDAIPIANGT